MSEKTHGPDVPGHPVETSDLQRDNPIPGVVDPLDLPHPGVGPVGAITRFYKNYAKFSGRASRSEYWWATVVVAIVSGVLGGAALAIGSAPGRVNSEGSFLPGGQMVPVLVLLGILSVGSLVPSIAVGIRRLHDANFSGLLYLVALVPYLGSFALLVLFLLPSKPEGARFDTFRPTYPALPPLDADSVPNGRPESAYPLQNRQTPPGFS